MTTIVEHPDAATFLSATHAFRSAEPVLTNILGSVATGVVEGRQYESERWLTVEESGQTVGIAMRTAPWHLAVSPMPLAAARLLGRHLADVDPDLPGINGPRQVVEATLDGLASPRRARVAMVDIARVLGTYVPPLPTPGSARLATAADLDLLVRWHLQFGDDVGLPTHDIEASVAGRVSAGALWLWEVDGTPAAMAGHAAPVPTPTGDVVRIGPVYTVAALRGRGYGAAVTAAVTEHLIPRSSVVMLFADAAAPHTNRIYQRLGFDAVAEIVETVLEEPA